MPEPQDRDTARREKKNALADLKAARSKYISGGKIRLRRKKMTDVRNDYTWQSDVELARLDAAPVLKLSFAVYLLDYIEALHRRERATAPAMISMTGRAKPRWA
jgi:hypothetical protein